MRRTLFFFYKEFLPLCCIQSAALRPTRVLRIHPQLVRLIIAGGVLLFQAFITAHNEEARKLQERAEDSERVKPMTSAEALQVLGLDSNLSLPLMHEGDRQQATRRFRHFFEVAEENKNFFLQGKFSAAYRLCVDAEWDAKVDESANNKTAGFSDDENTRN